MFKWADLFLVIKKLISCCQISIFDLSKKQMLSCQNQEQAKDIQFNFVLEVLANAIRQEKGTRCVQREGKSKAVFVCS